MRKLTAVMTKALIHFHRTGNWDGVRLGTVCALLDRDLVGHSRKGTNPDLITDAGRAVLIELGETVAESPVLRLLDTRTGLVRRILGTSLTTNAPHTTIVWVQREGEQGAYAWSADELMSTWHDLAAIDENGRTNAEQAEALEIAAFEQAEYDHQLSVTNDPAWCAEWVPNLRLTLLSRDWDPATLTKRTPPAHRYYALLRKYAGSLPSVRIVTTSAPLGVDGRCG
jgi:hypothetical protein